MQKNATGGSTPPGTQAEAVRDDIQDLQTFGYAQELDRSLGSFSAFAAGFSYISVLTGMFQLFYLGFGMGGPAFFWSWPLVLIGQTLVALCFAELASQYPLSGGVYQWSKYVANKSFAWLTGWVYLACLVVTLAAVAMALQNTLPQIHESFQFVGSLSSEKDAATNAVILGCGLIAFSMIINSVGVHLLAVINNTGVLCELFGILSLIAFFAFHCVRSPLAALFEKPQSVAGSFYLSPFLAATALTASYVMYGFDTAGSLAEETTHPRIRAPRAILRALLAAGMGGFFLLALALMAAPDLKDPLLTDASGGLGRIVIQVLGPQLGRVFLVDVVFAIFVCVLAVHSGVVRILFAMARDGQLPFSAWLRKVSPHSHLPAVPVFISGTIAILFLLLNLGSPKVVQMVTSVAVVWANLAYFLVVAGLLWRRLHPQRTTHAPGPWTLGKWGLPVNVMAVLWSAFMFINAGWPRAELYGDAPLYRFSALWLTGLLLLFGGGYYFLFQKASNDELPIQKPFLPEPA